MRRHGRRRIRTGRGRPAAVRERGGGARGRPGRDPDRAALARRARERPLRERPEARRPPRARAVVRQRRLEGDRLRAARPLRHDRDRPLRDERQRRDLRRARTRSRCSTTSPSRRRTRRCSSRSASGCGPGPSRPGSRSPAASSPCCPRSCAAIRRRTASTSSASASGLVDLDAVVTGERIEAGRRDRRHPVQRHPLERPEPRAQRAHRPRRGARRPRPSATCCSSRPSSTCKAIRELLESDVDVRGLAHITGDGFLNLLRLEAHAGYRISAPLPVPPVFVHIAERGGVEDAELYEVFNMGCGFCVVVPREDADAAIRAARPAPPRLRGDRTDHDGDRRRRAPEAGPDRPSRRGLQRRLRSAGALLAVVLAGHARRPSTRTRWCRATIRIRRSCEPQTAGTRPRRRTSWLPAFPILHSSELARWRQVGAVLDAKAALGGQGLLGAGARAPRGRVLVYYAAKARSGRRCVAVASSARVRGPYRDHGPVRLQRDRRDRPAAGEGRAGRRLARLEAGRQQPGASRRRSSPRRSRPAGSRWPAPPRELFRADAPWEGGIVEAPALLRRAGMFYLVYSAGRCCGRRCNYVTGVARARGAARPVGEAPGSDPHGRRRRAAARATSASRAAPDGAAACSPTTPTCAATPRTASC